MSIGVKRRRVIESRLTLDLENIVKEGGRELFYDFPNVTGFSNKMLCLFIVHFMLWIYCHISYSLTII